MKTCAHTNVRHTQRLAEMLALSWQAKPALMATVRESAREREDCGACLHVFFISFIFLKMSHFFNSQFFLHSIRRHVDPNYYLGLGGFKPTCAWLV